VFAALAFAAELQFRLLMPVLVCTRGERESSIPSFLRERRAVFKRRSVWGKNFLHATVKRCCSTHPSPPNDLRVCPQQRGEPPGPLDAAQKDLQTEEDASEGNGGYTFDTPEHKEQLKLQRQQLWQCTWGVSLEH